MAKELLKRSEVKEEYTWKAETPANRKFSAFHK